MFRFNPMTANRKARLAFTSAIALLFVSGVGALFTFSDLKGDEHWVAHTHEVQDAIAEVESGAIRVSRARLGYILSGNEDFLPDYQAHVASLNARIQKLKELTKDNPTEQANCERLEKLTKERMRVWEDSIRLGRNRRQPGQEALTAQGVSLADQMTSVTQAMRDAEERLLIERRSAADRLLTVLITIVITAFSLALLLFFIHYKLLIAELRARQTAEQTAKQAEQIARKSEEASRRLSGRLLQLQDEERRRFARDLHDSLGQYLVSLKMNLSLLLNRPGESHGLLAESIKLVDDSITETRTLSYLLHPPMLDEAGFASAASWYVNGFAQRSGVQVKVNIAEDHPRLPSEVELALFRILQECLTNIHKHAKSTIAEITVDVQAGQVCLTIADNGKGIPNELLSRFQSDGTDTGVGLSGMRERVSELGGQLRIHSSTAGTTIAAVIPLAKAASAKAAKTGSPFQRQRDSAA
jgi:signal transduction histidine kinase